MVCGKLGVTSEELTIKISASADGGPCSRVRARGTLRSAPHRHQGKFSGTRVCRIDFTKFPHFPVKIGLIFGVPQIFFSLYSYYFRYLGAHSKLQNCSTNRSRRNSPFRLLSAPNRLFQGARGGPRIFFSPLESLYLCYLGAHAKFQNCRTNPSGRNSQFWLLSALNRLFQGAQGGPRNLIFIGILIFLLLRSPCKYLKSYDKSFLEIEQTTERRRREK